MITTTGESNVNNINKTHEDENRKAKTDKVAAFTAQAKLHLHSLPGELIAEKIAEMEIDVAELARQMEVPVEMVKKIINVEAPLTFEIARKLEEVTLMPAESMMRYEVEYHIDMQYAMIHPEIPAYLGTEIINQQTHEK